MLPISGVANCHVEGLYSFMLSEDERVFVTRQWTTLAANEFGDAVGFHDHHRHLQIDVVMGEIATIGAHVVGDVIWKDRTSSWVPHPYPYEEWEWDSSLRGGAGQFTQTNTDHSLADEFRYTILTPTSIPFFLTPTELHTVKQLTKVVAWKVTERHSSTVKRTVNWSRQDLSDWHLRNDNLYQPLEGKELERVWKSLRVEKLL